VPIASRPEVKSDVAGFGPCTRRDRMKGAAMSMRISGFGSCVRRRITVGLTISMALIVRTDGV
jgi:hypothetical protein